MISDDEDGDHYGLVETGIANAGDSSPLPSGRGKKPWKVHRHTAGSMHSTNLYRHYRPDFRELAKEYPGAVNAISGLLYCWGSYSK